MTGFEYPEATMSSMSSGVSSGAGAGAVSPAPGYASFNQSINLLMTSAGGLLVLVGFVAFGIWLCGRFSDRNGPTTAASTSPDIKPGLSKEAIARIPVVKMGSGDCCAICLGEFNAEECQARLLPECRHSFHVECIDTWLFSHKTCPTCRSDLSSLDPHKNELVIVVVDSAAAAAATGPPAPVPAAAASAG